jgi:aspartyl-tRNA(Asn)/glutamyl-tRNA(Gln) amidotransferase subunit A
MCAFPVREKPGDIPYPADVFALSANLAGLPALSLPCAYSRHGLPVGMQLIASHFQEHLLCKAAFRAEQALGCTARIPD